MIYILFVEVTNTDCPAVGLVIDNRSEKLTTTAVPGVAVLGTSVTPLESVPVRSNFPSRVAPNFTLLTPLPIVSSSTSIEDADDLMVCAPMLIVLPSRYTSLNLFVVLPKS